MDKFIILTEQEISDWGIENISKHLVKAGYDRTGLFGFTTVPIALSSKTVYSKSEIDAILRDDSSAFYTEGY